MTPRRHLRAATVRATRVTLCRPRALRPPARSFEARSAAASGASSSSRRAHPRAGSGHAAGHDVSGLPGPSGEELVGVRPAERYDQIEPVEKRRRETSPVTGPGGRAATAGALVDALPAGTGVHGGDEKERRREGHGAAGAAHPDDPLLERLAQCLQRGHRELAELIEEEDAVGGQADLAGPQGPAASTDQGDDGSLVMRRPEGRTLEQRALGHGAAGGRMDAGHRQRLGGRQRWEQSHEALGEHRLARTRRPDHEEVVTSRRGDLNGAPAQGLTPHVGQVGLGRSRRGSVAGGTLGQGV